ncbi:hypothetical protein [Frigoriglobus tundricola]|uniref:Uncharacterized protein n=1 Tax=Frigoriglobus tundricola TaxID=2774151 RepID=A0A6M5YMG4_9BACT|nr:hypothetical protein [Frigoriglobus tundricola]QJW94784.1 hypothetical protein FTUN_2307 [Frigoriglobus tundricola]
MRVELGAKLNPNHSLRLGQLGWVRQQFRDNPKVVEEVADPRDIAADFRMFPPR